MVMGCVEFRMDGGVEDHAAFRSSSAGGGGSRGDSSWGDMPGAGLHAGGGGAASGTAGGGLTLQSALMTKDLW